MPGDDQIVAQANTELYTDHLGPKQVRLLYIDPESESCSFEIYELEDAPGFICISYTWGAPEDHHDPAVGSGQSETDVERFSEFRGTHPTILCYPNLKDRRSNALAEVVTGHILIDGKDHRVPVNVLDIIARVLDFGDAEYLWVDSLSINQADSVERSAQVRMMGDIYSSAQTVAVWLGWDDRD